MLDTDLDEELQHLDHPIEDCTKEERECTDEDDQEMPPLVDVSTDEAQTKECSPDPGMLVLLLFKRDWTRLDGDLWNQNPTMNYMVLIEVMNKDKKFSLR